METATLENVSPSMRHRPVGATEEPDHSAAAKRLVNNTQGIYLCLVDIAEFIEFCPLSTITLAKTIERFGLELKGELDRCLNAVLKKGTWTQAPYHLLQAAGWLDELLHYSHDLGERAGAGYEPQRGYAGKSLSNRLLRTLTAIGREADLACTMMGDASPAPFSGGWADRDLRADQYRADQQQHFMLEMQTRRLRLPKAKQ